MNCNLILGALVILAVLAVLYLNRQQENFQNNNGTLGNIHPDIKLKRYVSSISNNNNNGNNSNKDIEFLKMFLGTGSNSDASKSGSDDYIKKTNIELAARSAAREYCPVTRDYDPSQYIRKTEIPEMSKCPKLPDLKDFVLKSTIPPSTKCPSCVCPKVKVSAGLCKNCPSPDEICPKPKACGAEQCRNIIKCPEPAPCPTMAPCVCPPVKINQKPLKCPPPAACPMPSPCPRVERCAPQACPRCKFYGVKTLPSKPLDQQINDLLNGNDPQKGAKLAALRALLGVRAANNNNNYNNNNNNNNNNEGFTTSSIDTGPNVPSPTSAADLKNNAASVESVVSNKPVIDYNNKCEDNSLLYSAVGVLGSRFN